MKCLIITQGDTSDKDDTRTRKQKEYTPLVVELKQEEVIDINIIYTHVWIRDRPIKSKVVVELVQLRIIQ